MTIELTDQQRRLLAEAGTTPPTVTGPETDTAYVLVRRDLYERLQALAYDDSPWTGEERDALAWEAGRHAGWDDMSEYDDYPEEP